MVLSRIDALNWCLPHSWKVLEVQTTNQERAQDKLQRCWTAWSVFHHYAHRTKSAVFLTENLRTTLGVFDGGLFEVFEPWTQIWPPDKSWSIPANPATYWYLLWAQNLQRRPFFCRTGLLAHGLLIFARPAILSPCHPKRSPAQVWRHASPGVHRWEPPDVWCFRGSRRGGDGGQNFRHWGVDVPQIGNSEMFSSQDFSLSGHPKRVG